ncbi:MAG: hypothetical protein J7K64_00165, partial [Bacteroidales bacterium]|nr:hypothetical protein [Bacteroidales bacterium]
LSILSLILISSFAQKINYTNSWGKQGFNLISQQKSSVQIVYSINEFSLKDKIIRGEEMTEINLSGNFLFNDAGMPNLPGNGKNIAVPKGATVKLSITDYEIETYKNISVVPAPIIPFDTEKADLKYIKNTKIYNQNSYYPKNPVKLSAKHQIRGIDFVTLGITPFQYNPVKKELIVYKNIKVKIDFIGGKGEFGENRLRSKWWDPILEDDILNYNSLPKIDYSKKNNKIKDNEAEYVILTLDNADFIQWADSVAEFRRKQGISTQIYTINEIGGNTVSAIETWVDNAYNTWSTPPAAVLILADYGESTNGITAQRYDHPYSGTYITDNKYADVDEDDLPDIAFARITARNAGELETMIKKDLDYERNPPVSSDFYNHPISALGWQTERWFQICSEVIGGFWSSQLGKNTVRINAVYDGNPNSDPWSTATNTSDVVDYFGPDGLGYIPASPSELSGWTGGDATAVNNALNNGSFMLQHRDHGGETGWGEPSYQSSNINGLTNTNLSFIMSINCLTGRFDYGSEVFAEKFHRYSYNGNGSGALGIIAATQISYSFVNDVYVWGAYDNMWPDFMPGETANPESRFILPAFANVAGKNFLYQSGWPYNTDSKQITYRLFHHHGDAFLNVYSEVPQDLSITAEDNHIYGNSQYNVTVDNGAYIALTYYDDVNKETVIVATGDSNGSITSLDMTNCPNVGTNMTLTITKQNYFRYSKNVLVIPPSGPYDIVNSYIVNDGNNNQAEYNESFNLDITLKNVGTVISQGITATLSTSDPYVALITNATDVAFSDLNPDETVESSNKFNITLSNNVPDQHTVIFNMSISDNSVKSVYESIISLKINAPAITIGDIFVTNDDNADGRLDPGETGDINFTITNSGHATADFTGTLSESSDPNNYL